MIQQKTVETLDSFLEDKKETLQKIFLPIFFASLLEIKTLRASQTLRSKKGSFKIYILKHHAA